MFTGGNKKFGASTCIVSALILTFSHREKELLVTSDKPYRGSLSLKERAGVRAHSRLMRRSN
jgi:hypothetical protein